MRDHLGDHRIVVRRDLAARLDAGVDPDAVALEEFQRGELAGRRQEAALGILGIEPRLDRVAAQRHVVLRQRQRLAGGDAKLPFDQIVPGDALGDRMLDLQPRVHFHEPEAVGLEPVRAVGDELDGAGADITDRLRGGDRGRAHAGADLVGHAGRRRLLDHLLMPPLQRAIALVEMDGVAVLVGEHLDLDMARRRDIFLDQHAIVAERRRRLAHRAFERLVEIGVPVDAAHALAAAAGDRLDQHRIADLVGLALEELRILLLAVIARHHRHAGLLHQRLGAILQPHGADRIRRRADEHDAGLRAGFREFRRSPTEIRSPDGCIARGSCARPRSACRSRDSFRARAPGRSDRPRRRSAHAAHSRRRRNRPRWCAGRAASRCARCGRQSLRDWRSERM